MIQDDIRRHQPRWTFGRFRWLLSGDEVKRDMNRSCRTPRAEVIISPVKTNTPAQTCVGVLLVMTRGSFSASQRKDVQNSHYITTPFNVKIKRLIIWRDYSCTAHENRWCIIIISKYIFKELKMTIWLLNYVSKIVLNPCKSLKHWLFGSIQTIFQSKSSDQLYFDRRELN